MIGRRLQPSCESHRRTASGAAFRLTPQRIPRALECLANQLDRVASSTQRHGRAHERKSVVADQFRSSRRGPARFPVERHRFASATKRSTIQQSMLDALLSRLRQECLQFLSRLQDLRPSFGPSSNLVLNLSPFSLPPRESDRIGATPVVWSQAKNSQRGRDDEAEIFGDDCVPATATTGPRFT